MFDEAAKAIRILVVEKGVPLMRFEDWLGMRLTKFPTRSIPDEW